MDNTIHDAQRLKELQALPLERKIQITQNRIQEWYLHYNGSVFISFSGGKDSTVLAHLAKQLFPDIPLVFSNTGLEYTAIQQFAKESGATFVYPSMMFNDVVSTYGYPIISKEVAEAIHYARRIRSGGAATIEREREREDSDEKTLGTTGLENRPCSRGGVQGTHSTEKRSDRRRL